MSPEQIITRIDNTENGCEGCQWYDWSSNTAQRKRICSASQPAFPHGGEQACKQWYKPKTKKGNGVGRTVWRGGGR